GRALSRHSLRGANVGARRGPRPLGAGASGWGGQSRGVAAVRAASVAMSMTAALMFSIASEFQSSRAASAMASSAVTAAASRMERPGTRSARAKRALSVGRRSVMGCVVSMCVTLHGHVLSVKSRVGGEKLKAPGGGAPGAFVGWGSAGGGGLEVAGLGHGGQPGGELPEAGETAEAGEVLPGGEQGGVVALGGGLVGLEGAGLVLGDLAAERLGGGGLGGQGVGLGGHLVAGDAEGLGGAPGPGGDDGPAVAAQEDGLGEALVAAEVAVPLPHAGEPG